MNRKQRRAAPSKVKAALKKPETEIWVGFAIVQMPKARPDTLTSSETSFKDDPTAISQEVLAMLSTAGDKDTAISLAKGRTVGTSKIFAIRAHTSPDVKKLTNEIGDILISLKVPEGTHVEWTIKILAALSTLFKLVLDKK